MKAKVWGARGSVPVSGPEYMRYGGDTTCLSVESDAGDLIVMDAGTGVRRLGAELLAQPPRRVAFLLSHAHWDHVIGFPFFKPLYFPNFKLDFYGNTHAQASVRAMLSHTMMAPFFPVDLGRVAADLTFHEGCGDMCRIGSIEVHRFPLSHPNGGCGFRLEENGRALVFFPDNEFTFDHKGGRMFEAYVEFCRGANVLIHDAEYLPGEYKAFSRGWGHSIYADTVRLGLEAGVDRLVLWHLNQDRSDDAVDAMLESARALVAESGSPMVCDMAYGGMTFEV